jgi:hypothetical protein
MLYKIFFCSKILRNVQYSFQSDTNSGTHLSLINVYLNKMTNKTEALQQGYLTYTLVYVYDANNATLKISWHFLLTGE